MQKAINGYTGTVHYAHADSNNMLIQNCGMRSNQTLFLDAVSDDTLVTCRKCVVPAKAAPKAAGATKISPAMVKVLKVLASGEWITWSAMPAGIATLDKMIALGLIESRYNDTEFRKI